MFNLGDGFKFYNQIYPFLLLWFHTLVLYHIFSGSFMVLFLTLNSNPSTSYLGLEHEVYESNLVVSNGDLIFPNTIY